MTGPEGAVIKYTLNNTDPRYYAGTIYDGPFTITTSGYIKATAIKDGKFSEVTTKYFVNISQAFDA